MTNREAKNHQNPAPGVGEVSARRGSSTAPVAAGGASSYSIMNNTFRVDARYSALKAIGKGSFGIVCSATDEKQVCQLQLRVCLLSAMYLLYLCCEHERDRGKEADRLHVYIILISRSIDHYVYFVQGVRTVCAWMFPISTSLWSFAPASSCTKRRIIGADCCSYYHSTTITTTVVYFCTTYIHTYHQNIPKEIDLAKYLYFRYYSRFVLNTLPGAKASPASFTPQGDACGPMYCTIAALRAKRSKLVQQGAFLRRKSCCDYDTLKMGYGRNRVYPAASRTKWGSIHDIFVYSPATKGSPRFPVLAPGLLGAHDAP